jgi:hypothetical protein
MPLCINDKNQQKASVRITKYLQITISTDDFLNKWGQNGQSFVKTCCPYLNTLVSGSPIIQNGKLVGAVTHVLINDPTTGYGIFVENMLLNMPVPAR